MFYLGLVIGALVGWFFTRLYYSSHAKKEVKDAVTNTVNKIG
jgi:hypothetical protein